MTSHSASKEEKKDGDRMFEIDIPMRKQGASFDADDKERQRMLALKGTLEEDDEGQEGGAGRRLAEQHFQPTEVYYNEGATELFLACENTDWRKALQLIQQHPFQAKVWVISTGTVETTLGWSLWRRLPLHEACRRQAPAWMVSALLSVYPVAAQQTTQFGELPLHLAVECGAPPEVVNLLVVTYWHGITATDQSGRTPLEILHDSEMLAMEDHQVVFESLTRSQETYQTIMERHQEEVKGIKVRHAAGLVAIRQQHDEDLQQEQEQQEKLLGEVERLRRFVDEAKSADQKNVEQIHQLSQMTASQKLSIGQLQERLAQETQLKEERANRVAYLEQVIANKNGQIAALENQVAELQQDLQKICAWQQDTLGKQINITEESMQAMVEEFVGLVDLLSGQGQKITSLLRLRQIPIPAPSTSKPKASPASSRSSGRNDDKKRPGTANSSRGDEPLLAEEELDAAFDEIMMKNIAAAASSALQS